MTAPDRTSPSMCTESPVPHESPGCACDWVDGLNVYCNSIQSLITAFTELRRSVHDYEFSVKSTQGRVEKAQSLILKLNEEMISKRDHIWTETSTLRDRVNELLKRHKSIESMKSQLDETVRRSEELTVQTKHLHKSTDATKVDIGNLKKLASLRMEKKALQDKLGELTLSPEYMVALQSGECEPQGLDKPIGVMNTICAKVMGVRHKYVSLLQRLGQLSDEISATEESNKRESLRQIQAEMHRELTIFGDDSLRLDDYRMSSLIEAKKQNIELLQQRNDRERIQLLNLQMEYDLSTTSVEKNNSHRYLVSE